MQRLTHEPDRPLIFRIFIHVTAALALMVLTMMQAQAQEALQRPDTDYTYPNTSPAYASGSGPVILIATENSDFVANNSHLPFVKLAEADGFQVRMQNKPLSEELSAGAGILVLMNNYLKSFIEYPAISPPSAYSDAQISAIRQWVEDGGSLLILADHAPYGGGTSKLASVFGFEYLNGNAADTMMAELGIRRVDIEYTPQRGLNSSHPVTDGSTGRAAIKRYFAFGGQAFIPAEGSKPLLTLPQGWSAIFTYGLRREIKTAPRIDASGMSQGSTLEYGKGRMAVFTEAGGFTAQIVRGVNKFGFNTPEGSENPEFVLSVLRWLAGYTPDK